MSLGCLKENKYWDKGVLLIPLGNTLGGFVKLSTIMSWKCPILTQFREHCSTLKKNPENYIHILRIYSTSLT